MLQSLTLAEKIFDLHGTCHSAWNKHTTINGDIIHGTHLSDLSTINARFCPDVTVWMYVNRKNLSQLCQRIVVLEFLYARDSNEEGLGWTPNKHNAIAGSSWPPFSTNITDYPTLCLNELCQVAYNRSFRWTHTNNNFTFQIDSDELFGDSAPVTVENWLASINCTLDTDFFQSWKSKQHQLFLKYRELFTWTPDDINYITMLPIAPEKEIR